MALRRSKILTSWQILDDNGNPYTSNGKALKNCYKKVII